MKNSSTILAGLVLAMAWSLNFAAGEELNDPYAILKRNFDTSGGLDHARAEQSQYVEGTITVAGFTGSLKVWTQKPLKSRMEVDLKVIKQTQGDNGEYQWILDSNGKLQKITSLDEAAQKRREIKRRMDDYEYADPQSKIFKVTLEGTQQVQGNNCYVIKITNNLNADSYTSYINASTYLVDKTVIVEGEDTKETINDDYRKVDGLMVAFHTIETTINIGQKQEVVLTKYESNPKIDEAMFEPPKEGAKDFRFTSGHSAENIPFQFIENHIFLPVIVACKERTWVLDTGAGMSVISQKFADELGLQLEGNMKGKGAGGTVDVKFAALPPYQLHGIDFDGQTVAVIDMTDLNRTIGFECAGILGFDFLSRFVTKVDYANELLSFYDPETFKYVGDGNQVTMHVKEGVFAVDATLDGVHSGSWLFDMGASRTDLNGPYAARNGFPARQGVAGLGRGAGATFAMKSVKCSKLEFAGYVIDSPVIGFETSNIDTAVHADEVGTLGNTLFCNFVIYADYAHERLYVEKGDSFDRPFPRDNSGLQLMLNKSGEPEAIFIAPGTPAASSGIQVGDVVESVNGLPVERLDGLNALRALLKEKPGTEYALTVKRQGSEKTIRLKLADLYGS